MCNRNPDCEEDSLEHLYNSSADCAENLLGCFPSAAALGNVGLLVILVVFGIALDRRIVSVVVLNLSGLNRLNGFLFGIDFLLVAVVKVIGDRVEAFLCGNCLLDDFLCLRLLNLGFLNRYRLGKRAVMLCCKRSANPLKGLVLRLSDSSPTMWKVSVSKERRLKTEEEKPTSTIPCLDGCSSMHWTVYKLCSLLDKLLSLPKFTPDAVLRIFANDEALNQFFTAYQRHGSGGGTNAKAARLANATKATADLTEPLLAMQDETGGFRAHAGAPFPDLLSTSVAVFALHLHHIAPRYDVKPFIEAHWQDDGCFAASLLDGFGDVEYEFYGLLALGSIHL